MPGLAPTTCLTLFNVSAYRCLSKNAVGVIEMDPLPASWLTEACCVLHNLCIDWGVRELRSGENKDPEIEQLIQEEAGLRFARAMRRAATARNQPSAPVRERNTRRLIEGQVKRARYIYFNYGGPRPTIRVPRQRAQGRQRSEN